MSLVEFGKGRLLLSFLNNKIKIKDSYAVRNYNAEKNGGTVSLL